MKLNDRVYDVLKWVTLIALPSIAVFYSAIAGIWGLPYAEQISQTANILCTLLGALIGISTASYNKEQQ